MDFSKIAKIWGAILIFSGTCVGAGMLALPLATAAGGFFPSLEIFILFWLTMVLTGLYIIEVNLWMPEGVNLITMAKNTLGKFGLGLAWISYLLLMYAANSAYIAGGTPLINDTLYKLFGLRVPYIILSVILSFLMGVIVYKGMQVLDYINRILMIGLIVSYCLFSFNYLLDINPALLKHGQFKYILSAVPIIIASFTGHMVIPSLRTYLGNDHKSMIWTVVGGCTIPLVLYIIWQIATLGTIPFAGEHGLFAISQSSQSVADLNNQLAAKSGSYILRNAITVFFVCALVTSFMGITLSLSDFLKDGFNVKNTKLGRITCITSALLPPYIWSITYPGGFEVALDYAGAIIGILIIILPMCMVWRGRYILNFQGEYKVPGGKVPIIMLFIIGSAIIFIQFLSAFNYLPIPSV